MVRRAHEQSVGSGAGIERVVRGVVVCHGRWLRGVRAGHRNERIDSESGRALRHLVARLFNGSPSLLVLNVLADERIAADELARVKKLIEEA